MIYILQINRIGTQYNWNQLQQVLFKQVLIIYIMRFNNLNPSFGELVCSARSEARQLDKEVRQTKIYHKGFCQNIDSFDRDLINAAFSSSAFMKKKQYLEYSYQFKTMVRRHGLFQFNLDQMCISLCSSRIYTHAQRLHLVQGIKFSVLKGGKIKYTNLIQTVQDDPNYTIGSKLLQVLNIKVKTMDEDQFEHLKTQLEKKQIFNKPFCQNSLNRLKSQLYNRKLLINTKFTKDEKRAKLSTKGPKTQKVKNQQKTKLKNKNNQSEETEVAINDFINNIKSKNKIMKKNFNQQIQPTIEPADGSDQSWWSGTYYNVKQLFQNIMFKNIGLKKQDRQYLDDKLISHTYLINRKNFAGGLVGEVLIDRMIVNIFLKLTNIEKNKAPMNISEAGIEKLVKLCGQREKVKEWLLNNQQDVGNKVYKSWRPSINDSNSIQKALTQKISDILKKQKKCGYFEWRTQQHIKSYEMVLSQLGKAMDQEVDKIRKEAIQTIYNINLAKKGQLMKDKKIKYVIQNIINSQDLRQIKKIAYKIVYETSNQDTDHDFKLTNSLKILQSASEQIQFAINYLIQRTFQDDELVIAQFNSHHAIQKIFNAILNQAVSDSDKIKLCQIISNYIQIFKQNLPEQVLKGISDYLKNDSIKSSQISQWFAKILLFFFREKRQKYQYQLMSNILRHIQVIDRIDCGDKIGNILILILEKCEQFMEYFNINMIAFKLDQNRIPIAQQNQIKFEDEKQSNSSPSISVITASIMYKFLKKTKRVQINQQTEKDLFTAFKLGGKQTKILSLKILYLMKTMINVDRDRYNLLKQSIDENVWDISVYSKVILSHISKKIKLNHSDYQTLVHIYQLDTLCIDENNFTQQLRENIIKVFTELSVKETIDFNQFYFLLFTIMETDANKERAHQCAKILKHQALLQTKFSSEIVLGLQSQLFQYQYSECKIYLEILSVFEILIKQEYLVSDRVIKIFQRSLYERQINENYQKSVYYLSLTDCNREISDQLFSSLEKERAAEILLYEKPEKFKPALIFLRQKTSEGQKLTTKAFSALEKYLTIDMCLEILQNIVGNKQILPEQFFKKLVTYVTSNCTENILSFLLTAINQQLEIPTVLINQLKSLFLRNRINKNRSLLGEIFLTLASKNACIQLDILFELYHFFSELKSQFDLQYSRIILETGKNIQFRQFNWDTILAVLLKRASSQEVILNIIRNYEYRAIAVQIVQIILINIQKNKYSDQLLKLTLQIFKRNVVWNELNPNLKKTIELVCSYQVDDCHFLNRFITFDGHVTIGQRDFLRINQVLKKQPGLRVIAISVIQKTKNLNEMPSTLLQNLSDLYRYESDRPLQKRIGIVLYRLLCQGFEFESDIYYRVLQENVTGNDQVFQMQKKLGSKMKFPQQVYKILQFDCKQKVEKENQSLCSHLDNLLKNQSQFFIVPQFLLNAIFIICSFCTSIPNNQKLNTLLVKIIAKSYSQNNIKIIKRKHINKVIEMIEQQLIKQLEQNTIRQAEVWKFYLLVVRQGHQLKYRRLLKMFFTTMSISPIKQFSYDLGSVIYLLCQRYYPQKLEIEVLSSYLEYQNGIIKFFCFKILKNLQKAGIPLPSFQDWLSRCKIQLRKFLNSSININEQLIQFIITIENINFSHLKTLKQENIHQMLSFYNIKNKLENHFESLKLYKELENFNNSIKKFEIRQKFYRYLNLSTLGYTQIIEKIKFLSSSENIQKVQQHFHNQDEEVFERVESLVFEIHINRIFQKQEIKIINGAKKVFHKLLQKKVQLSSLVLASSLNKIGKVSNLKEFEQFFEFLKRQKVNDKDIEIYKYIEGDSTVETLLRCVQVTILGGFFKSETIDRSQLAAILGELLDKGWMFQDLKSLLLKAKKQNSFNLRIEKDMFIFFRTIRNYCLSPAFYRQVDLVLDCNQKDWLRKLNEIIVKQKFFDKNKSKTPDDLFKQLKKKNKLFSSKEAEQYRFDLQKIKNRNLCSIIYQLEKKIIDYDKDDIKKWASLVKNNNVFKNGGLFNECISVIARANNIHTGYNLKDAQIISILVLIKSNNERGKLLQVSTGEGKSTIVSIFAIIKALQGLKVDIITSSPILAQRDAKQKEQLYSLFNLTCSDNNDKAKYLGGTKKCYSKDIVYGEASQFQFDTLRDIYSKLSTLGGRKKQIAIVDQVDSMLIDDSSKIARLSSTIAGIDQLQIIYHFIWKHLRQIQKKMLIYEEKTYFFQNGKINHEQGKTFVEFFQLGDKYAYKIPDIFSYIKQNKDIQLIGGQVIQEDYVDFIKKIIKSYIEKLVEKGTIKIPINFKEFVKKQIRKWIDNAIIAEFWYEEDVNYIIHEGIVKPVDYSTTGLVQSSTNWSDGLHQFLQIKHGLKMTSETFTTNFISNMGYFSQYGPKLFGLTGTIGSQSVRHALNQVYKVDIIDIPRSSFEQFILLPPMVASNQTSWVQLISASAIQEAKKMRAVLIISQTIQYSQQIYEFIKRKYPCNLVKLYTMNDMDQEKLVEKAQKGQIIIATNLAGRGTDIKTDDIEKYGGLHVILTFMPLNQRVQDQAFGRTARQGKKGTGQMILNFKIISQSFPTSTANPLQIRLKRDEYQKIQLEQFVDKQFKEIKIKDKLFKKLCQLLDRIRKKIRQSQKYLSQKENLTLRNIKDDIYNVFSEASNPSTYEINIISSIQQKWALFLRDIDDGQIKIEKSEQQYQNKFQKEILKSFLSNQISVIQNPFNHISIANDIIINSTYLDKNYLKAQNHLKEAIKLDKTFSTGAYMSNGWLLLRGKKRHFFENQRITNYKREAIQNFQGALQFATQQMTQLTVSQHFVSEGCGEDCNLFKQLLEKQSILGSYCNSLQQNIKSIQKSLRFVNVGKYSTYQDKYPTYKTGDGGHQNDRDDYNQTLCHTKQVYKKYEKQKVRDIKNFFQAEQQYQYTKPKYSIEFHNLTARNDSGYLDQALDVVKFISGQSNQSNGFKYVKQFKEKLMNKAQEKMQKLHKFTKSKLGNIFDLKSNNEEVPIKKKEEQEQVYLYFVTSGQQLKQMLNQNLQIYGQTKDGALAAVTSQVNFICRHIFPQKWSSNYSKVQIVVFNEQNQQHDRKNWDYGSSKEIVQFLKGQKQGLIYNINFFDANEKWKKLEKVFNLSSKCLCLQFQQLNFKEIENIVSIDKKLKNEKKNNLCSSYDLQILSQKDKVINLAEIICADKKLLVQKIQLKYQSRKKQSKNKSQDSLNSSQKTYILLLKNVKKYIEEVEQEQVLQPMMAIRINKISLQILSQIKQIIQNAVIKENVSYKIKLNQNSINCRESLFSLLDKQYVTVFFKEISCNNSTELLPFLRDQNIQFKLVINNLQKHRFKQILNFAIDSHKAEQIQILKEKSISQLFMDKNRPDLELGQFSARGIEYLLEVNERKFIPWRSIAGVSLLAALQIGIGVFFVCTGFGATVGMGIITEGAADIFTAVRAYSSRQFTWKDYAKQKAVSLAISAASMGWSAIKDAAKGVKHAFSGTKAEILKYAQKQVVQQALVIQGKSIGQKVIKSAGNLGKLAWKHTATSIGQNCVRQGINYTADTFVKFGFDQLKPKISGYIQQRVSNKFTSQPMLSIVYKMFALDMVHNQNADIKKKDQNKDKLKKRIDKVVLDILNPQNNWFKTQWASVGGPLCKGVLSSGQFLGNKFSMAMRIAGTLNGLYSLFSVIDNIHKQILRKLVEAHQQQCMAEKILSFAFKIPQLTVKKACQILKSQKIIQNKQYNYQKGLIQQVTETIDIATSGSIISRKKTSFNYEFFDFQRLEKSDLKKSSSKQLKDSYNRLLIYKRQFQKRQISEMSEVMKAVSDKLTDQIIKTLQSQIISPWTSYAAGQITNQISKNIQHNYLVDHTQSTDQQIKNKQKYEQIINLKQSGQKLNFKQLEFLKGYNPYVTFSKQIQLNAKEYTIAYSQCQMIHFAGKPSDPNHKNRKNKDSQIYGEKIRNGQPLTHADVITISELNGIKIRIVDDTNQKLTKEQIQRGIKLVLFLPGIKPQDVGHYQLFDKNNNVIQIQKSGQNNCGLDIISHILKQKNINKTGLQLRQQISDHIQNNSENYAISLEGKSWIESRYPNEANALICLGGKRNPPVKYQTLSRYQKDQLNYIFIPCKANYGTIEDIFDWITGDFLDFVNRGVKPFQYNFPQVVFQDSQSQRFYQNYLKSENISSLLENIFTYQKKLSKESWNQENIKNFKQNIKNMKKISLDVKNFDQNKQGKPVNISIIGHGNYQMKKIQIGREIIQANDLANQIIKLNFPRNTKIICDNCCSGSYKYMSKQNWRQIQNIIPSYYVNNSIIDILSKRIDDKQQEDYRNGQYPKITDIVGYPSYTSMYGLKEGVGHQVEFSTKYPNISDYVPKAQNSIMIQLEYQNNQKMK